MATYNNSHWLLCHIRNSFISTDDTGLCETIMMSDDLPTIYAENHRSHKHRRSMKIGNPGTGPPDDFYCYPGLDANDADEMDLLSQSYDVEFGRGDDNFYRSRNNKLHEIEKPQAQKNQPNIQQTRIVQVDDSISVQNNSLALDIERKEVPKNTEVVNSLLTYLLDHGPKQKENKFAKYGTFDGTSLPIDSIKTFKIFVKMLPESHRDYPIQIQVISTAKILELIGLICYQVTVTHPDVNMDEPENYGLYIAEDDGDTDEFPPLDHNEPCSKFGFKILSLLPRVKKESLSRSDDRKYSIRMMNLNSIIPMEGSTDEQIFETNSYSSSSINQNERLLKKDKQTQMIEAPIYKQFLCNYLHCGFLKRQVQLGVSGDKVEVKSTNQRWKIINNLVLLLSFNMDNVVNCQLVYRKALGRRGTVKIVCNLDPGDRDNESHKANTSASLSSIKSSLRKLNCKYSMRPLNLKNYYFETDINMAEEIVEKFNNILEIRSSIARREYMHWIEKQKFGNSYG